MNDTSNHDQVNHDQSTCPQCLGMVEAAHVLGGFAEALQKMLDDGVFERLGREMAERRERAVWDAILGDTPASNKVE